MTSRSRPSAAPLAARHASERGEKILVDRIGLAVDALLFRHFLLESPALLGGVGEFAEGVGELDPAGVEFEALGDAGVAGADPGERRLARGIVA